MASDLATISQQPGAAGTSSESAVASLLNDFDAKNSKLGAFTFVDAANAIRAARDSDARRSVGATRSPIDGLPVAVKANIAVKSWPYTAGLRFRAAQIAEVDAFVVQRLRNSGAIIVGLTNMDEGALGAEGRNPWFLDTQNPRRPGWSAGGSSSGSAAAVAGGLVPLALGTDTIGSLRIPASFCGICSLKPTFGLVSCGGIVGVHPRFDHAGPMAATVKELQRALAVLSGYDPACRVSFPVELTPRSAAGTKRAIAYATGLDGLQLTDETVAGYNQGIAGLRTLGHRLTPLDFSSWDLPRLRRAILALCELEMWRTHQQRVLETPGDFSDALRAFIRFGHTLDVDDIHAAERRIAAFSIAYHAATRCYAACILPTTPCASFAQRERHPQNTADLTSIASATGCPALSLPMPVPAHGMPVGLQMIGPPNSDLELLRLGAELEAALKPAAGRSG